MNGCLDLATVAHNAGILEQTPDVTFTEFCDAGEVEALERLAEVLTLTQNGEPRKPGLKAFQTDLLEQKAVFRDWKSPLRIVVGNVVLVLASPETTDQAVGTTDEPRG